MMTAWYGLVIHREYSNVCVCVCVCVCACACACAVWCVYSVSVCMFVFGLCLVGAMDCK